MISQREDAHVATAADTLTSLFKDKPKVQALLASYTARIQTLEADLWQLLWGWVLQHDTYNASGKQLDDLGAVVGQPREGRSDADYIIAIKVRIRVNRSHGKAVDVIEVARLINALATYVEYPKLSWEVSIYNVTNSGDIIRFLTQTKAASSYGVLLTSTWAEANVFKWDWTTPLSGTNHRWGAGPYTGGPDNRWAAAFPTNPPYRRS